jgi:hypothetical protein
MAHRYDILSFLASTFSLLDYSNAVAPGTWYFECKGDSCGYGGNLQYEDCHDLHPSCKKFAQQGECFANPPWMLSNCKQSCGLCYEEWREKQSDAQDVYNVPNDDKCVDMHTQCPNWASQMECFTNPAYMAQACPASCWLCVNAKNLRQQGASEMEIQHRHQFSLTDFGLWQTIPPGAESGTVRKRLTRMGQYALEMDIVGPGTVCSNLSHDCIAWAAAADSNACQTNLLYMLQTCSLACEYCDLTESYHKCRKAIQGRVGHPFHNVESVYLDLVSSRGAVDLVHSPIPGSCSPGVNGDDEGVCKQDITTTATMGKFQDEWVLSLDKSMLWGEGNTTKMEDLVTLLKSKGDDEWIDVPHEEYKRSGQVLNMTQESSVPIMEDFLSAFSTLLNIPQSLFEVEFVRYQRGGRFEGHKDVRLHDLWKYSGARVLSTYIILQSPTQGGAYGFPDLDWLLVKDPQILVWPNIQSLDSGKTLDRMNSEQLPVIQGELYAAHVWIHEYTFDVSSECA